MSVWDDLVGQDEVVAVLREAARAAHAGATAGMTNAWLITGPPGSGRSTAAVAFAAALLCEDLVDPGCGRCEACRSVRAGSSPDVTVVSPAGAYYRVEPMRELVARAAWAPSGGRWQVIVCEDTDRMRGPDLRWAAANVLLKAVEEPTARTVWVLCAPSTSSEDVLPTIRSRCRHVGLRTPSTSAVAELLVRRDGVDPSMATFAARASQGHIGRARRLATDEQARIRRRDVLALPTSIAGVGEAILAAESLVSAAKVEATELSEVRDAAETLALRQAFGMEERRRAPTGAAGALRDLEAEQKRRGTRVQRDALDLALLDLLGFYRDVLVVALGADVELVNAEIADAVRHLARTSTPESVLGRVDAVGACRAAIASNVAPLLAVEAMVLALRTG
ncbi:MAG: DNA polymerase III subunit delta' [Actinomycetes bacterium]